MDENEFKWECGLRQVAHNHDFVLIRRRAQRFKKTCPGAYMIADLRMASRIVAGIDPPLADLEAVAAWFRRESPHIAHRYILGAPNGEYYSATSRWTLPGGGYGLNTNFCR